MLQDPSYLRQWYANGRPTIAKEEMVCLLTTLGLAERHHLLRKLCLYQDHAEVISAELGQRPSSLESLWMFCMHPYIS